MSMSAGAARGAVSEINVTPLIDVLLVLLIIFMVIVPVVPKGLDALIPQPSKEEAAVVAPSTIVVQVLAEGTAEPRYRINEEELPRTAIEPRLQEIFSTRQEKVMFVKGDKDLDYSRIAEVIDFGKQAGIDHIGVMTPGSEGAR